MTFDLQIPSQNGGMIPQKLNAGEMVFILGANGSGKSSLILHFAQQNRDRVIRISAHRQTWMESDELNMTPASKVSTERTIKQQDLDWNSRYRDVHSAARASITIYDLIDAENIRARKITKFVEDGDMDAAKRHADQNSPPIATINQLLQQSNIPITIEIQENQRLMAIKEGGLPYSAVELSDGERNALLIAGSVLTAPSDTLLVIDEPERHLHRSIIAPLLSQLFELRSDCGFVISTHDHNLPLEVPCARILLLRSCRFNGNKVQSWEADELPNNTPIDDVLKRDLIGARQKLLFVEGTESSLDKQLYSIVFPMVSVIPKGNCYNVEKSVVGVRAGEDLHWLRAFGIVDGDGFAPEQIQAKREIGVYALPYYSVEAIYFHPQIIEMIAERQIRVHGVDKSILLDRALKAGVDAIRDQTERLSMKVAKKSIRKLIIGQIPNDDDLLTGESLILKNHAKVTISERKIELDNAVATNDWKTLVSKCPVRESNALDGVAKALEFNPSSPLYDFIAI